MKPLDQITATALLAAARRARKAAYAPYSGFCVGAALLGRNGKIYTGCNVENVSFGATNRAERTAVFSAVADSCREFEAIAIAAGDEPIYPCGICRQVLAEFSPNMTVICAKKDGSEQFVLSELLPHGFNQFCAKENKPNV